MFDFNKIKSLEFDWDTFINDFLPSVLKLDASILIYEGKRMFAASDSFYKNFGFADDDLDNVDATLWKIYEERENFNKNVELLGKEQKVENDQYVIIDGRGKENEVRIQLARLYVKGREDIFGCLLLTDTIHFDISDDPMEWEEDLFRAIVDNSLNGIVLVNDKLKIIYANPAAAQLYGYDCFEEMKDVQIFSSIHPDSVKIAIERFKNWMEGKPNAPEVIYKIIRKDGTVRSVMSRTHDTLYLHGMKCHLHSLMDITDRINAEEGLKKSEEKYRLLAENISDVIWVINNYFQFEYISPSVVKLNGYTAREMPSIDISKILTEDSIRLIKNAYQIAIKDKEEDLQLELKNIHKDGRIIITDTKAKILYDGDQMKKVLGVSRDITERKEIEKRLKESQERLNIALQEEVKQVRIKDFAGKYGEDENGIQYPSPVMQKIVEEARISASSDGNLLILGSSGVGKSYLARWIHQNSPRNKGPFLEISCTSIPASLIESELFGHEHGSFTGTKGRKRGLIELAEGGTLFLDEIGDMEISIQSKILQFLDKHVIRRIGGETSINVNTRIIAATNQDLAKLVQDNLFREDLYYRLNVLSIQVPPLRERKEDIPIIAKEILHLLARDMGLSKTPILSHEVIKVLLKHDWPGNIRELRNVLERALLMAPDKDMISSSSLLKLENNHLRINKNHTFENGMTFIEAINEYKIQLIESAYSKGKTKKRTAELLGISRHSLDRQLKNLGLMLGKRANSSKNER